MVDWFLDWTFYLSWILSVSCVFIMLEITLVIPLGYGDMFLCSGAAVYASERCDRLNFPCCVFQLETVKDMFKNYPNIFICPLKEGSNNIKECIYPDLLKCKLLSAVGDLRKE